MERRRPRELGSADDLDATIREARRFNAAAIVVAAPNLNEEYLRELDATGTLVVAVDNAAEVRFPNKLVVNPFLGLPRDRFQLERGTQLLRGSRYPLIRPQIRRLRPLRAQEPPQPFRLVALEDDMTNLTQTIAERLVGMDAISRVDLFARPHHPQFNERAGIRRQPRGSKLVSRPRCRNWRLASAGAISLSRPEIPSHWSWRASECRN